jgi:hypothetical protein
MTDVLDELGVTEEDEKALQEETTEETTEESTEETTESTESEESTEPTEPTEPAEPTEPVDQKQVPLAALQEARAEIKDLKGKMGNVDELKRQVLEIKATQDKVATPPPATTPDFGDDPFGNVDHRMADVEAQNAKLLQDNAARDQRDAQQVAQHNIVNQITAAEVEFVKGAPDYQEAVNYLSAFRSNELKLFGVTDPAIIRQNIAQDAFQVAAGALQQGRDPAELIYKLAQQYGYKTGEKPADTVDSASDVTNTLADVSKGEAVSKTLSKGGDTGGKVTAEGLLSLEGDAFDEGWKQLFGT